MSYSRKAYESSLKAHKKLIATKLLDGIEKLYDNKMSERRWIWELLQNAKDVADKQVKIEIILKSDSVEFLHNGNPFLMDNITYLIEQVSTKDRTSELGEILATTGKFGTGFMTTHLLSKKVEVKGVLEDQDLETSIYKRFNLKLDRDAKTPDEMIAKVDQSYEVFTILDDETISPALTNYQPYQNLDTSFKYDLDRQGFTIAQIGIDDLHNALTYTLIFIPKIESVTVIDQIQDIKTKYSLISQQDVGSNIKISTLQIESGDDINFIKIASIANQKQTIILAIPIEEKRDAKGTLCDRTSIIDLSSKTPKLFCEFPLVGSEKFSFPTVFNSPLFNPSEPRDAVLLDDRDDEKRLFNKSIFTDSLELYYTLLDYASEKWDNIYLLAKSAIPTNIDHHWYKEKIQKPLRQKILETAIVDTYQNQRIALNKALIPYHSSSNKVLKLWQLSLAFFPERLPVENHVMGWYNIIDGDWKKDFNLNLRYELSNLAQDIAQEDNLSQLAQRIDKSTEETLNWLNEVIAFIEEDKSSKLLDKYPIIPNQYGTFQTLNKLSQDLNIPEEIKYVLKVLGKDWKQHLGHLGIKCNFTTKLDIKKASNIIDEIIEEGNNNNLRKAIYYLISCFPPQEVVQESVFELRHKIWEFAKNLDDVVPDIKLLNNHIPKLWDKCDSWLLKTLVSDLVKIGNLQNLQTILHKDSQNDTANWLSDFITFLNDNNTWRTFYLEEAILPNQHGIFNKKDSIYFDTGIPEEIKDVLGKIDIDYRTKLLDKRIQGFDKHSLTLTVSNASDEINKCLIKAKDSLDDASLRDAIFTLISYFSNDEDSDRKTIWNLAQKFYGNDVIKGGKIIPNLVNFDWNQCNDFALKCLSTDVSTHKNLDQLAQHINTENEDASAYLDHLIYFISKQNPTLFAFIENLNIFPNQNGDFLKKKELKKDAGIDSELKDICAYLMKEDWYSKLLLIDEKFTQTQTLFDERETESPQAICHEIDKALKEYKGDRQEYNFVQAVKLLFSWFKKFNSEKEWKELLPYFYDKKAEIFIGICDNPIIKECVLNFVQFSPEKAQALVKLGNISGISESDINLLSNNPQCLQLMNKINDQGYNIEEILNRILQKPTSRIFSGSRCGGSRIRTYPQIISFEDTNEVIDVGLSGEEFVYRQLVAKFGCDRIRWMNQDGETKHPYDFQVLEDNLEDIACYIDAKSSRKGEHSDSNIFLCITNAQWDFLKECDNYYIAKVFRATSEKPNLKLIKIDLTDDFLK